MGDWFQVIVDCEASEEEGVHLVEKILNHLIEQGIVTSNRTDCVLGADFGYPPGSNYEQALIEQDITGITGLWTNGLEIITERTVFDSGQGGFELICPACGERTGPGDHWGEAVDEWYNRTGQGMFGCPKCNNINRVINWAHDPPFGFGCLGFKFWNWPPLNQEFINEISCILGHRTVFVTGKL